LLVEDNIINQKVMFGMLRSLGFKSIELAADGVAAVKMVTGKPVGYDLVLMDINMPVLDGHEASQKIRDAQIKVPIIAMTAYALKGDREKCLEYGMNDYVPKPVDRKYLIKVLATWLLEKVDYRKAYDERLQQLKSFDEKLHRLSVSEREAVAIARRESGGEELKPLAGDKNVVKGWIMPLKAGEQADNAGVMQGTFEEPACIKIPDEVEKTERPNENNGNDTFHQTDYNCEDQQQLPLPQPAFSDGEVSPRTPGTSIT